MQKFTSKQSSDSIPSEILYLILNILIEVMRAERGSIMLLDEQSNELSIRCAQGLREEIIRKTKVKLGKGISGKVALSGRSLILKGSLNNNELDLEDSDFINPAIDTSYIMPVRFDKGTLGTININSTSPNNEIRRDKEIIVKKILNRFSEYLIQADLPTSHQENPSELFMMNMFREYSTIRTLRGVFDYIFNLITDVLGTKKKGVLLLKNKESGYFDLILGYGFETNSYRHIYEELVPKLEDPRIKFASSITLFSKLDLLSNPSIHFPENYFLLLPFIDKGKVLAHMVLFSDTSPEIDSRTEFMTHAVCASAGTTIRETVEQNKFEDLASTDSLTGMYNYGLWWRRLDEEINRSKRMGETPVALIIFDIDNFDRFNKESGHHAGDQLLRVIADKIISSLRSYDLAGRIGGDEFGIALPNTCKETALNVAERILNDVRGIIEEMNLENIHPVTMSGGIVQYPVDGLSSEDLVDNAKTALVSAKIMGGNNVKSFNNQEE